MSLSAYNLSQRRLRRAAWLRAEIELERERLRQLLEQSRILLDRISSESVGASRSAGNRTVGKSCGKGLPFP
jgi:hypothetical protein